MNKNIFKDLKIDVIGNMFSVQFLCQVDIAVQILDFTFQI